MVRAHVTAVQANDTAVRLFRFDVLRTLIDELVQIGLTDGFLSTQLGGKFDAYNRHTRAREIGHLIAKIGHKGIFKADGRVLEHDLLLEIVM